MAEKWPISSGIWVSVSCVQTSIMAKNMTDDMIMQLSLSHVIVISFFINSFASSKLMLLFAFTWCTLGLSEVWRMGSISHKEKNIFLGYEKVQIFIFFP
ncbi:hypothetical protein L2E82_31954 [Cichorium intybus]|uniref:Uncharacterized protein n=1 Tax=Cichorium intybus TaxID=13427 RepID=A0ACB9BIX1_CICIN|nr:hypothetical protein L2E82_31954 [Cichorium intybus]